MIELTDAMRDDFSRDGAIKVKGLLSETELADCRRCFDFNLANPSPTALEVYQGTSDAHYNDLGTAESLEYYQPMLEQLDFASLLADLWRSEHVWYFGEEIFIKDGGKAGRTLWHQDTPYMPAEGAHLANVWISFEPLLAKNALEVIRGSHVGPMYDGASFMDSSKPTDPLWGPKYYPSLPDIEAERKDDPDAWDVLSWDLAPGDALVVHSGCLHGGAPVDATRPTRHTLVLRFFGDDVRYRPFPDATPNHFMDPREYDDGSINVGDLYRGDHFLQLR